MPFGTSFWPIVQLKSPVLAVQRLDIGGITRGRTRNVVLQGSILGGKCAQWGVRSALVAIVHCGIFPVPWANCNFHVALCEAVSCPRQTTLSTEMLVGDI